VIAKVIDTASDALGPSGPRGIRNNNPGNIERTGDAWRGMSADQGADERFVVFDAPVWGLRAMARILRKYIHGGSDTIREIVGRWAPVNENDAGAYIAHVAQLMGVSPDTPISDAMLVPLMQAITQHENGIQPYAVAMFDDAVTLERQT